MISRIREIRLTENVVKLEDSEAVEEAVHSMMHSGVADDKLVGPSLDLLSVTMREMSLWNAAVLQRRNLVLFGRFHLPYASRSLPSVNALRRIT